MVSHWSKGNRAVGNCQPVEVHVAKLVLDEERQVSGQIEVEATECLISWTVELVFLKVDSTNCGLHMRDCDTDAAAKVRLQTAQEILVALSQKPAVRRVSGEKVQSVREVKGLDGVAHAFRGIDRRACAGAGDMHSIVCIQIHLRVEELHSKSPVRLSRKKIGETPAIVERRFPILCLIQNLVKGEVCAASLFQMQVVVLGHCDAAEQRDNKLR